VIPCVRKAPAKKWNLKENFSSEMRAARFDEDKGEIYSSTGKGKIPWISVKDIGAVGYRALVDEVSHNTEHILLGPELLSYDDVSWLMIIWMMY
jgi:festuclavine dehydrogenase